VRGCSGGKESVVARKVLETAEAFISFPVFLAKNTNKTLKIILKPLMLLAYVPNQHN
jgi:hypothetical protein